MDDKKASEVFSFPSLISAFCKPMETIGKVEFSNLASPQINHNFANNYEHMNEMIQKWKEHEEAIRQADMAAQFTPEERDRKEASEEAFRQETIRSLNAIEQNTANLHTLIELINKNNEQQEELIALIAEVLSIAKAKTREEAESAYREVMGKITKTIEDVETVGKIAGFATTVWNLTQPIIDKLLP